MNSRLSRPAPAPINARADLVWIYDGVRRRATLWPDVLFEQETAPGRWEHTEPTEAALAAAALGVSAARWRKCCSSCRPRSGSSCKIRVQPDGGAGGHGPLPAMFAVVGTPALTAFLAAHRGLRGGKPVRLVGNRGRV